MVPWVRRLLTFACLLAAWTVARPAAAAAPVCDEHAASMVAPPPTLDAPSASVDVGEPDPCDSDGSQDHAYHRGQRSHRSPPVVHAEATLPPPAGLVAPPAPDSSLCPDIPRVDRAGVRFLLERPPR